MPRCCDQQFHSPLTLSQKGGFLCVLTYQGQMIALTDNWRPHHIGRNWPKPKRNRFFSFPTTHQQIIFCFFSKVIRGTNRLARRRGWHVSCRALSFGPGESRFLPSGYDGGTPPAGSLVNLGYFQCDGYQRAQHCLEKEEDSLWTTQVSHRRAAVMELDFKHLGVILIINWLAVPSWVGHLFSRP